MMKEEAANKKDPLTQNFIRTLHHTLLREDYTEYRTLPNGVQTSLLSMQDNTKLVLTV